MLLECRRSRSFTYRVSDREMIPRPVIIKVVPAKILPVYLQSTIAESREGTAPVITSFRSYPAVTPMYERRRFRSLDSADTMTRLFITPSRGGDVRSRASINRISSSINSIPSLYNCYSSDVNLSRLNNNNNSSNKSFYDHNKPHNHHYLQHQQQHFSRSTSNILSGFRETPQHGGTSVSRSHSIGGISSASTSSPSSASTVLGDTVKRNPRGYTKVYGPLRSFRKSGKLHKVPNPSRTMTVFACVKKGIGEFIQATHDGIAQLMASENGTSTAQKIKSAGRFLKKLEFHLAKIDELHESYLLNEQLRDGARNMAKAFSATRSLTRKHSIASIKCGYKECSQVMCAIEAELENLLGTFSCKLQGIAGFARVVPGDVFEVVIKHGDQKWKTKGRIGKDSTQHWDSPDFTFKCLVGEMLSIKASEVRHFRSQLLGQKNCEIWNPTTDDTTNQSLFSTSPQLMTVSINLQGSLKLSIVISWNPVEGMDESFTFSQSPISRPAVSTYRKQSSSNPTTNGSLSSSNSNLMVKQERKYSSPIQGLRQRDDSGIYGSATSLPSQMASDSQNASPMPCEPSWKPDFYANRLRPYSISTFDMRYLGSQLTQPLSLVSEFCDNPQARRTCMPSQSVDELTGLSSASQHLSVPASPSSVSPEVSQTMVPGVLMQHMVPHDSNSVTLGDALVSLMTTLEDFLGHYPELRKLEEVVQVIEALINKSSFTRSRSSSMNGSIEGAIEEAFEFLNTEEMQDDLDEADQSEVQDGKKIKMKTQSSDIDRINVSRSSTAKTADSGIESLAKCLQEDIHLGSSFGSSPVPPSSGNEHVDQALVFHLSCCDKLLENLGNFGPLKCREFYALEHLQRQAEILEKLVEMAKAGTEVDLHTVLSGETKDKALRELWMLCVDQSPLSVHPEKVVSMLEQKFGARLAEKYEIKPTRIFHQVMSRMLYVAAYVLETCYTSTITLHQFMLFFRGADGLAKMEEIAKELHLMDILNASSNDTVIKAIENLHEELPAPVCLKLLTKLLVSSSPEIQHSASKYLKTNSRSKTLRDKAMVILVEGLEDHITEVRAGCCVALSVLKADECLRQLVHVCQSDSSSTVRRKAKEALYSLGDGGRKAMEETQLSSQGFQGFQMHKISGKKCP